MRLSRRGLLIGAGGAGALLALFALAPRRYASALVAGPGEHVFDSFIRLAADGAISVAVPVCEMGQGITTLMAQIVAVHYPHLKQELLAQALQTFYEVRDVAGLKKKPSTSEFLDWLKLLMAEDIPAAALRSQDSKAIVPPLHGALLKNEQDVHLFERLVFMSRTQR